MCHITFHIVAFKNLKTPVLDGLLNPELIPIIMCHITFHIVAFKNLKTPVLDGLLNPELIHIIMCHITFHIVAFKNFKTPVLDGLLDPKLIYIYIYIIIYHIAFHNVTFKNLELFSSSLPQKNIIKVFAFIQNLNSALLKLKLFLRLILQFLRSSQRQTGQYN